MEPEGKFGRQIRDWRERAEPKVSRAKLDQVLTERHELSAGYTALLESGRIKPPAQDVCATIAEVIGRDADEVWRLAATERADRLDPDLALWIRRNHEFELDLQRRKYEELLATSGGITTDEVRLLERVRDYQNALDKLDPGIDIPRGGSAAAIVGSQLDGFLALAQAHGAPPERQHEIGLETLGWLREQHEHPSDMGEARLSALEMVWTYVRQVRAATRRAFQAGHDLAERERRERKQPKSKGEPHV